ncbi:BRCT domain-containing protein [Dorcoceras hygrometricum]|uniref:BRCT domain-containing protein n=1 Tax=Dorcoceras hygrometricum TaxID=472368 RepID=A0A2Z7D990_9LAMI|nr:BRCT domain-containing protein [Dorcoceras hygrometricum]
MSTFKAVRAAQFIPHSFNLPQQISPGEDNRTTVLLCDPLQVEITRQKPAFALNRNQQQPSDVAFFFTHQNDSASTNQNDAAALQQLITDSFRNNQQLVTKRYTQNASLQLIKTMSPHYQQLVTQTNGWSLD